LRTYNASKTTVLTGTKKLTFSVNVNGNSRLPSWILMHLNIERQKHIEQISQTIGADLTIYSDAELTHVYSAASDQAFIDCEPVQVVLALDVDDNWANEFRVIAREIRLCFSDDPDNFPIIPTNASSLSTTGCNSPGDTHIKSISLYQRETSFQNTIFKFQFIANPPYTSSQLGFTFVATPLSSDDCIIEIDWYSVLLDDTLDDAVASPLDDITYTYTGEPNVREGTHAGAFRVWCRYGFVWRDDAHCCVQDTSHHDDDDDDFGHGDDDNDLDDYAVGIFIIPALILLMAGLIGSFYFCRRPTTRPTTSLPQSTNINNQPAVFVTFDPRNRTNGPRVRRPANTSSSSPYNKPF
jgi:hypothetical protein